MIILLAIIAVLLAFIAIASMFGKSAARNTFFGLCICVGMTFWLALT